MAARLFANDHQDHFPGEQANIGITVNGISCTQAWFGAFDGAYGNFYADYGLLSPSWGKAKVGGCPSDENETRSGYGPVDYAYCTLCWCSL